MPESYNSVIDWMDWITKEMKKLKEKQPPMCRKKTKKGRVKKKSEKGNIKALKLLRRLSKFNWGKKYRDYDDDSERNIDEYFPLKLAKYVN